MDPLWKELPGLLLELLHTCSHDVFVFDPSLLHFIAFLKGPNTELIQ
jgi:hypothetical protein